MRHLRALGLATLLPLVALIGCADDAAPERRPATAQDEMNEAGPSSAAAPGRDAPAPSLGADVAPGGPPAKVDTSVTRSLPDAKRTFDRVVIGRMYQQDHWTVKGHDAAYVATQMGAIAPTYVSGLVRLGSATSLRASPEIVEAWVAVMRRLPSARFDFVLNICDYATSDAARAKMTEINDVLGQARPDIWFFDFWDRPLNQKPDANRPCAASPQVVADVIAFAHAQQQLVGGNVWSPDVPAKSDFLSVPDEKGLTATLGVVDKVSAARPNTPLLVHIENNPQKGDDPGNDGLAFATATKAKQQAYLESFAAAQQRAGYSYMFPVFFPLLDLGAAQRSWNAEEAGLVPFLKTLADR